MFLRNDYTDFDLDAAPAKCHTELLSDVGFNVDA